MRGGRLTGRCATVFLALVVSWLAPVLASAAVTVTSAANPNANGLPSGGNSGDCVLNTAPGVGAWGACPGAGTGAPTTSPYITATSDATLTTEFALGSLSTGLLINTATTGIPTIYSGVTCTNQVLRVLNASGAGTCSTITSAFVDSSIIISGGALGTPSSGTLTNATGLPVATGLSGLGSGVATFLATPTSANLASALTDESGTSGGFVRATGASFAPSVLNVPNSTTLPGTCTVGDLYMDTDATSGQRIYACQASNTWVLQGDGGGGGSGYATIQDEGSGLTQRTTLNFEGSGVSCVDNAGSSRTDCTITGSGGGLTHPEVMARASIGF